MLLKVLKTNQVYQFFLIPIMALAIWIRSLIHPQIYSFHIYEDMTVLYRPIAWLLNKNPFLNNLVALILLIALAFIVMQLNERYSFIRVRTFLPSSLFVLITSGLTELHSMHPVYFAALFLLLAINRIFGAYEQKKALSNAFDSGLLIGIGSLFYYQLIFFLPICWISLIIIPKKLYWRNFALAITGFIIPWIFTVSFYAITQKLDSLLVSLEMNFISYHSFLSQNIPVQLFLFLLVFLTLIASISLMVQYDEKKISSRKYFQIFFWVFLISMILILAIPAASREIFIILAIPLTYLISNYLIFIKRKFWGEFFMYLLTTVILYLQLM